MKRAIALLSLLLSLSIFTMDVAYAKRLGGGASFGRSYNTAPAPAKSTPAPAASPTQKAAPASAPAPTPSNKPKSGMMGGMLGGLLAGGLLAALFMGGAFDGIQLLDIVLIALFGFLLMRLLRRNTTSAEPAYAGRSPAANPAAAPAARVATAATGHGVPMNLPLGFDSPAFLAESLQHYRTLQQAWNDNALSTLQEYFSPELFEALKAQREGLAHAPATEILTLDAELVRAEQRFGMAEVSLRFTGHYRDVAAGEDEPFTDIWHLERDYSNDQAPWHIVGITSN